MRKKLLSIVLTAVMTASLAACGEDDSSAVSVSTSTEVSVSETSVSEVSVSEPEVTEPEVSETADEEKYMEMYERALKETFYEVYFNMESMYEGYNNLMGELIYMDDSERDKIGYCLYDVDGNGTPELIIGHTNNTLYALFEVNADGGVDMLFDGGYRCFLDIYEDGLIVDGGSSGAAYYSYGLSRLDGNGGAVLSDYYFTDFGEDFETVYVYHNTTGSWETAESENLGEPEDDFYYPEFGTKVDFSDKLTPIKTLEERYESVDNAGITVSDIVGVGWQLSSWETFEGEVYTAEEEGCVETIKFYEDGTVDYYSQGPVDDAIDLQGLTYDVYENPDQICFNYISPYSGESQIMTANHINGDGMLVIQWQYYTDLGLVTVNKYYSFTLL